MKSGTLAKSYENHLLTKQRLDFYILRPLSFSNYEGPEILWTPPDVVDNSYYLN